LCFSLAEKHVSARSRVYGMILKMRVMILNMSLLEEKAEIPPSGRWRNIGQQYRKTLSAVLRSSATWFFCAILLAALVLLALKGRFAVILASLPLTAFFAVFALLTIPLTDGVTSLAPIETHCSRRQLWWQVALLLVVILFVAYRGIVFNMPGALQIPLLYPFAHWSFSFLGAQPTFLGNWIAVPLLYFLIPLALLLLLGARWSELGLGRGYRSWQVLLLVVFLVIGATSLVLLLLTVASNLFQNGFFEEFLFRGALMTRLSYLIRGDWGLVLSALIFGLFHIGVQTSALHGDWLAGAAYAIIDQAIFGLGMALVFLRTRNLLASSIFHVLLNTVG
jgi:membrane protease YdiL (CAAX protease family)